MDPGVENQISLHMTSVSKHCSSKGREKEGNVNSKYFQISKSIYIWPWLAKHNNRKPKSLFAQMDLKLNTTKSSTIQQLYPFQYMSTRYLFLWVFLGGGSPVYKIFVQNYCSLPSRTQFRREEVIQSDCNVNYCMMNTLRATSSLSLGRV